MRQLARQRRRLLAGLVLAGLALGLLAAIIWPSNFRSEASVFVPRVDTDEGLGDSLEREARFANSEIVGSAVRGVLPDAPDEIDVTIDVERQLLRLQAAADSPDAALRLARAWADAFVEQRQLALTSALEDRNRTLEQELDVLAEQIGDARQLGDDAEVDRLRARRDVAAAERVRTLNDLAAAERGTSAAIVDDARLPTERSGIRMGPALLFGGLVGALAALLAVVWLDRSARQVSEASRWLPNTTAGDLAQPTRSAQRAIDATPAVDPSESARVLPPDEPVDAARRKAAQPVPVGRLPRLPDRYVEAVELDARVDDGRIRFVARELDEPLRIVRRPVASRAETPTAGD